MCLQKGNYVIIKHKLAQKNNYFENIPGIKQAMSSQALTYEANYDGDWFWEDKAKTLSFIGTQHVHIIHVLIQSGLSQVTKSNLDMIKKQLTLYMTNCYGANQNMFKIHIKYNNVKNILY